MKNEKPAKTLIKKKVAMKAMVWSVVCLEKPLNPQETSKSLLMKTSEEFHSFSSQNTKSGGRITNKLLKHIPFG